MYFALNLPLVFSRWLPGKVLLFPNLSKIFWLLFSQPPVRYFRTECKGKSLFISTKIFGQFFLKFFEASGVKINLICEELSPFFWSGWQR